MHFLTLTRRKLLKTLAPGTGGAIAPGKALPDACIECLVEKRDVKYPIGKTRMSGASVIPVGLTAPQAVAGGAAVPIGLTSDAPDIGVFLYFSFEHLFHRD